MSIESDNGVIQSDTPGKTESLGLAPDDQAASPLIDPSGIIWTPRFIVIFTLILVIGMSAQSFITQGWLNHYYTVPFILFIYTSIAFIAWVALLFFVRSWWLRIGATFGSIWALFLGINYFLRYHALYIATPVYGHIHAATYCAIFGCFTCLSIDRTPPRSWDAWFFTLAPVAGIGAVILAVLFTPAENRSITSIEENIALVTHILAFCVWLLRPSCWKSQPGPTLLFGSAALITFFISLRHLPLDEPTFFLAQLSFLIFFLAMLRIVQGDRRLRQNKLK